MATATTPIPFRFDRRFEVDDGDAAAPSEATVAFAGQDGGADPAEPATPAEASTSEPVFGMAELEQARAEAFAEGQRHGEEVAAAAGDAALRQTCDHLATLIDQSLKERETLLAPVERDASALALAIVRRVMPWLGEQDVLAPIEDAVRRTLSQVWQEPRLTVRVSERLRDDAAERLQPLLKARGHDGRLDVIADPEMSDGDCRIEWAGGFAVRDAEAVLGEIESVIEQALACGSTPAETSDPTNPGASHPSEAAARPTAADGAADGTRQ